MISALSIPDLYSPTHSVFLVYQTLSTPKTVPMLSAFMPFHRVNYTHLLSLFANTFLPAFQYLPITLIFLL